MFICVTSGVSHTVILHCYTGVALPGIFCHDDCYEVFEIYELCCLKAHVG